MAKSLLPGFPPFLPEDLVPGDEFMAFSGLGAVPGWLPADQKEAWKAAHQAAKHQMQQHMQQVRADRQAWQQEQHEAHKEWKQLSTPASKQFEKEQCAKTGGRWNPGGFPPCRYPLPHGPMAVRPALSGLMGFLGLGAGPDPNTMTCEKIISGYEKNALMASTRSGATHRANAQARVMELEPYYAKCGGGKLAPVITPDQPVDTRLYPGDLQPNVPGNMPAGFDMRTQGYPGYPGAQPGFLDTIDMKQVGIVAGAGLAMVVLVAILKKKKAKTA